MNYVLEPNKHDIALWEVFQAYIDCRRHKKSKLDCLEYDLNYEIKLIDLWERIKTKTFEVQSLSVFIVEKPVKREIFASTFEDRIVHHLVVNKLSYILEKEFIYDTYSCRPGRGTHFGIKRINKFMRQVSHNYQKPSYVLKLDIKGYFMSINKDILLRNLNLFLTEKYLKDDYHQVQWLCELLIKQEAIKDCFFKSPKQKWDGLPASKSLFKAAPNCGLPIGNYTNQIFANFYLNKFDHFIKGILGYKFYGRYVDDFVIFSNDKEALKALIPVIRKYLKNTLELELHPKKIYLQKIEHGVEFLGAFIKPWRLYVTPRIKNNFYLLINRIDKVLKQETVLVEERLLIRQQLNSYLGVLRHTKTYNLREIAFMKLGVNFKKYFFKNEELTKVIMKNV